MKVPKKLTLIYNGGSELLGFMIQIMKVFITTFLI